MSDKDLTIARWWNRFLLDTQNLWSAMFMKSDDLTG